MLFPLPISLWLNQGSTIHTRWESHTTSSLDQLHGMMIKAPVTDHALVTLFPTMMGIMTDDVYSCKFALLERKAVLEEQLVGTAEQPSVSYHELKTTLNGLLKLGKGPQAR
ncbi:hypothetical protein VNO78_11731 [Psophocarpus tetragonolobus]|uniref:Uncharacterized protein n=1 Tax=Psophocarpus tetragonolobus TaxID=3891 RepID=A0AAN9XP96_PSOTE